MSDMTEHRRLLNLLRLIRLLRQQAYSVRRLAQRFDVTERSVYRYLDILRDCGFTVQKEGQGFRIPVHDDEEVHAPIDAEEAALLKQALTELYPEHPLLSDLLRKLDAFSDVEAFSELIVDKGNAANIKQLHKAINEGCQVVLKPYSSLHSSDERDRLVEPVGFSPNLRYLHAYEPESDTVKQFKPERMGRVEVLDRPLKYRDRHRMESSDPFGMNGEPKVTVELKLSLRAFYLLREEFPLALPGDAPEPMAKKWSEVGIPVKGYEGIGRFVLGLPGELEVLGPKGFMDYLKGKRRVD